MMDDLDFSEFPEATRVAPLLPVPFLLDLLAWRRASGKVHIATEMDLYDIYIDRGRILCATSTHRTLRLGHLLLQRGVVEPASLHEVLRGRRPGVETPALGALLLAEGAVTIEDLAVTVEEQVVEVVSRLLQLESASFLLIADEPVPEGLEVIPLDTTRVVEAAERLRDQRVANRALQRLLPRVDIPLAMTTHLTLISHHLTDPELLVALHVDRHQSSLGTLSEALPIDRMTLNRTVISLMERGWLRVDYPAGRVAAP